MTQCHPLFLCAWCYISLSMSIQSAYRRVPAYFAVPLTLLASAVVALAFGLVSAYTLNFFLGKIHGPGGLGDAILAFFVVAPKHCGSRLRILIFRLSQLASRNLVANSHVRIFARRCSGLGMAL